MKLFELQCQKHVTIHSMLWGIYRFK